MSFLSSATVMDAVKARVAAVPYVPGQLGGEKLFQLVSYYRASDIARAFTDLYITKQRVCLIVPVSIGHSNDRGRHMLSSTRGLTLDLLFGDRSFDKGATAALTGGANNVGVMEMAERVIEDFFATPLALSDVAVEPGEGAPLLLTSEDLPNDPGRVCWVQTVQLRAGSARAGITV